jgi:starch synthase (maltosyl-transferring)
VIPQGKRLRHLRALRDALDRGSGSRTPGKARYAVPSLWSDPSAPPGAIAVDPFAFYRGAIDALLGAPQVSTDGGDAGRDGEWSRSAVVYNMLVRLTCAYDHDGDGKLGVPLNPDGWRETGTFLKAIAILPYIRSLGADTIHLLPVQEIGLDGRRGSLGSPYAVRNPRTFDPMLGEDVLGMPIEAQFSAFIEAAHHLGFRVILELPLRTLSKDCVWAEVHPDWFYWIREGLEFHPPSFTPEQIRLANDLIDRGICDGLPTPSIEYRSAFSDPPDPATVGLRDGRWVGTAPGGGRVVIPGAFADWPPDDNQPVWGDVTYLKLHQDRRYNYPAYNTVRMYDSTLLTGGTGTERLWKELVDVVSWYAGELLIDGMMVDMAHALPDGLAGRIIAGARRVNPTFAFWAEDFSRTQDQVRIGYNAVLGGQWACQHRRGDFRDMLAWLGRTPELLPHLAAPETHNTPRAAAREGGHAYTRYAWEIGCFIPGIPYIHSGFELGESHPVNTGLGFTAEELRAFPAEVLPLFSARALGWDRPGPTIRRVSRALELRKRFADCIVPGDAPFRPAASGDDRVIAFVRSSPDGRRSLLVAANSDPLGPSPFRVSDVPASISGEDLLSGTSFPSGTGFVEGTLEPGQVAVFAGGGG